MCKTRYLTAACLAAMSVGCFINITDSDRNLDVEVSQSFSYQLDAATEVRLRLEGINGVVTVLGAAGSSTASVAGERKVRSDTRADAEAFLGRVAVEVVEQGDEILVRTNQPGDTNGRVVTVDYDLIIPSDMNVSIVNVNGEAEVRSIDGDVGVDDVNGAVRVLDVAGDVEVTLVNGEVTCDLTPLPSGLVDVGVVNGNIRLDVPTSVSAMLEADVANGTVSVVGLTVFDATTSTRSVHGRLGAGAGLIDLNTTNGTITVRGH